MRLPRSSNAAKTDPTKAGVYYKNAAAVLYNAGQMDAALDSANKAIAADPNQADAYFIKGQALVTKSAVDPKTNKLTAPEGCVEAYDKFLALAPNDPKVPQVKQCWRAWDRRSTPTTRHRRRSNERAVSGAPVRSS